MSEPHFKEPRLSLSTAGEFLVRLVTYSSYVLLTASTVVLFFSGIEPLARLAVLFLFFLIDRVIHIGQGEKNLSELGGKNLNLAEAVTPLAYRALSRAFRKSYVVSQSFYFLFLLELAEKKDVREILKRLDIKAEEFAQKIQEVLKKDGGYPKPTKVDNLAIITNLALLASKSALDAGDRFIEPRSFFVALINVDDPALRTLFNLFDINAADAQAAVVFGRFRHSFGRLRFLPAFLGGFAHKPKLLRHRVMNRAWTARPTPTLDQFSTDLTDLAREEKIGFLIGHEKEFAQLMQIVSRPGKPNAILVGDPGSGKSSMIAHLAFRMVKDEVPPVLFDKRLVSLGISRLVSNATPDVLSGRLQKITNEILSAGNIILFIPNMHDLFRTAEAKAMNAIDVVLPVIKDNGIPVIGESYSREFKQFIEPRSDFLEQFEVLRVEEISEEEAVRFLTYESLILENQYGIFITYRAIREAVILAHRYLHNKPLPGSATDLLKMALTEASDAKKKTVDADMVAAVAEKLTRIPIQKAGQPEVKKLLNMENSIHEKFINQDAAVRSVARALREYRSGLTRRGGPIASFLFVGPTGVGKTELAKTLAKIQFGSKEAMQRFDMSEYQDKTSTFRLIGNPDGSRTGALTDAVLLKPYTLILLDEFEKANPDILNLFLQVLDDGRLTDSLSRTISFENTIIIATSNAHSEFIKTETEKGRPGEEIADDLKKKLTDYFKPELINRFSDVMVFRNLDKGEIALVTQMLMKDLAGLLMDTNGIALSWDDAVANKLADLGYSPVFGARPLRQVIADHIRSVLAEKILKQEIKRGDKVQLNLENDKFGFKMAD
ncbi:ATP-dependent Clp protease ATP-binding subunit [bacterium]|nr:MAG: ATP-dependent Clp protease ATP-binding subunit [bacterium]